jgi:uncharacterized Zn finger protein
VLESFGIGSRLQRGKRYARTGQVLTMDIAAGQVRASVQGSRVKPYRVFIENVVLATSDWDAVESVMASSAVFAARLLANEMPEEIEEAFTDSSTSLFPASADEVDSACSCPDWENPCKHIAAVYYLLAEAFDRDPFLIFAWRGRTKEELLGSLRSRRRGSRPEGVPQSRAAIQDSDAGPFGWPTADGDPHGIAAGLEAKHMSWWGLGADLAAIEIRPRLAVAPDLVLRQLDPEPLAADAERITDALGGLYEAITAASAALALEQDPE